MRRNSFGFRKKEVLTLQGENGIKEFREQCESNLVSPALAKWVYLHSNRWSQPGAMQVEALQCLRFHDNSPDIYEFLWRELTKSKHLPVGDWLLVALTGHEPPNLFREIDELIALYHDEYADLQTRGSAIFVLNSRTDLLTWDEQWTEEVRSKLVKVCQSALFDEANPYARAGGCWLAKSLNVFADRLIELQSDKTVTAGGSVSSYASSD